MDSQVTFLKYIYEQFENVEWADIEEELIKVVKDLISSRIDEQAFSTRMAEMNFPSDKMDAVMKLFYDLFRQNLLERETGSKKQNQNLLENLKKEQSHRYAEEQLLKEKELLKLKEEAIKKATRELDEEKAQFFEEIKIMKGHSQRNISKKKTIIYQKEDVSFSQSSIKMFCNTEEVKSLLSEVKNNIKCIGFFGDYPASIKIMQNLFPNAQEELNLKIEEPQYDQLISFSDGQNIFFLYENSRDSFSGDIFENEDSIILIRFLLDICGIIVICLNENSVSNWTDKILNDSFLVSTPPKIIKDRTTIVVKEINTPNNNISQQSDCQLLLQQDDSHIFVGLQSSWQFILDDHSSKEYKQRLDINKQHIIKSTKDVRYDLQDNTLNSLLNHKKTIEDIFSKSIDIQKQISILFGNLQSEILLKINQIQNEYYRTLHQWENSTYKDSLQDSQLMQKSLSYDSSKFMIVSSFMNSIEQEYLKYHSAYFLRFQSYERYPIFKDYSLYQLVEYFQDKEFKTIFHNDFKLLLSNYFIWIFFNKYWKQYFQRWGNYKVQISLLHQIKQDIEDFCINNAINNIKQQFNFEQSKLKEIQEIGFHFCNTLEQYFYDYENQLIEQTILDFYECNYDPRKGTNFVSLLFSYQGEETPSSAHKILGLINFDDNVYYIATINSKDPLSMQQLTFWIIQKKGFGISQSFFKSICHFSGSDFCFFLNRHSKQWVVFENTRKIGQIGKINSDYSFQEGCFKSDVFKTKISGTQEIINRIDSCFILNQIDTTIFLQDKTKGIFYSFSLQGQLQAKEFNITQDIDSKLIDSKIEIFSLCNNIDNSIYVFETPDSLVITNLNYITKATIPITRDNFKGFKLIETEWDLLLIVITMDLRVKTYVISEQDDSINNISIVSNKDMVPLLKGNIVIDKFLKAIQQYGRNFVEMKCPKSNMILTYFDDSSKPPANLNEKIHKYIDSSYDSMNLAFQLQLNPSNNSSNITEISTKIYSFLSQVDPIEKEDLALLILSRIPIQMSTIQQCRYIPLKDGVYSPEILEIQGVQNQVDQLKNNFSFGWFEEILSLKIENLSIVSMCGHQSIGKSSQLNRMFGTRFGVSAARCTYGVWFGFSKIKDKNIIVLDYQGIFWTRRTIEEEIKLLQQVMLISTVSIVFQDLEEINKPLLDLFNKLQCCVGKKKGEGIYFLGTLLLLTKNIADEGDKIKIEKEISSYLSQKSISGMMSLFKGGISYGYMKPFLAKDFDVKLKQLRNESIFEHIIDKIPFGHGPKKLIDFLKYSIAQLFLDDDEDVEIISFQDTIKKTTKKFKDIYNNLNLFDFPDSIFQINFTYSESEKEDPICNTDKNTEHLMEESPENKKGNDNNLLFREFIFNQKDIIFSYDLQNADIFSVQHNSQSKIQIIQMFDQQYQSQIRLNHNLYYKQFQRFAFLILEQRKKEVMKYYCSSLPKELKFLDLCQKYQRILETYIDNIRQDNSLCLKKCQICDRACIIKTNHKGDCSCETTHQCLSLCGLCKERGDFQCSKISGHKGYHMCSEQGHKCGQECQISEKCVSLCTYEAVHDSSNKHSCQEQHKCFNQCRFFQKCKKTCSLTVNHEEDYHQCDSIKCFDKCSLCEKDCNIPIHNHDLLLQNIDQNREFLKVQVQDSLNEDILIHALAHLCGDSHNCSQKCQKPGVCTINYNKEERNWINFNLKVEIPYTFYMPVKSEKDCILKIEAWESSHSEVHWCKETHRCDAQCPECKAFCIKDYGHGGNHFTKNHRNKEQCIVVNEEEALVKIEEDEKNTKEYKVGQSPKPETCFASCIRQGRAHRHLQVCQGDSECAQNTTPLFAKHLHAVLYPHTEIKYDLVYCKQYWNRIGWDSPLFESNENEIQLCNWACSHETHSVKGNNMNYCNKKAGHEGEHFIDISLCPHHCQFKGIDVCFTINTTSSMSWAFPEVKKSIESIIARFKKEPSLLRIAIVAYRDHPPEDTTYAYKIISDLTTEDQVVKAIASLTTNGGGDIPQAVMDGLFYSCTKLSWRKNSQRFLFHIGNTPPHGKEYGCISKDSEGTKKGCPCGIKKEEIARELKKQNILYYLVLCNSSLNMMKTQFESVFGMNFQQTIEMSKTAELNIQITSELLKECKYNPELFHVLND